MARPAEGLSFNGGTLQLLGPGLFISGRAITLNAGGGTIDTNGNGGVLTGPIGGVGGLTKTGIGDLAIVGPSTYSGPTSVLLGTLGAGAINAFSPTSAFTVASGGALNLNGFDQTIGSLAGAGLVANDFAAATLTTGGNGGSTTFSGVIADGFAPLSLTKTGNGTFTLSGISSYTGATTVNGGILSVTGDISSSSGVTVNSGAMLNGTGIVPNVTVNNGGILAPGLSPSQITINGNLGMASAAIYLIQVSPTAASKANVSGSANVGGSVNVVADPAAAIRPAANTRS